MAFGSGTRQWVRGTLAKIAASSTALGSGELLVAEDGGVYGGNGVASIKTLSRLLMLAAPAAPLTAGGALTVGALNTVDGTAGAFSAVLPTPTAIGQLVAVERVDTASTVVTISGTVRGASTLINMPGVGIAGEGLLFMSESLTSWRPIAGHKPTGWLDARYLTQAAATSTYLTQTAASGAYVSFRQIAKQPDLLVTGAVTRNADESVASAAVIWPDGTPGTYTPQSIDASTGAVNGYQITYGSPVTRTFTQPTMTRDGAGAPVSVPQIVVS